MSWSAMRGQLQEQDSRRERKKKIDTTSSSDPFSAISTANLAPVSFRFFCLTLLAII